MTSIPGVLASSAACRDVGDNRVHNVTSPPTNSFPSSWPWHWYPYSFIVMKTRILITAKCRWCWTLSCGCCTRSSSPRTLRRRIYLTLGREPLFWRNQGWCARVIVAGKHLTNLCLGSLKICYIKPPFPRSVGGKFHILCAHTRQLHLITHLLTPWAPRYDVYFVDQLSTCIPFLRMIGNNRVVFYCHFPDKLLANGAFVDGNLVKKQGGLLKRMYRYPMDWLEEVTTSTSAYVLYHNPF